MTFDVTQDGLRAQGRAAVANIPGTIGVEMDFRNGGPDQVTQSAQFAGTATARQLAAAGLDPGGVIGAGTGSFTAKYAERRDGQADVQAQADLARAALAVAGWTKPVGPAATARGRVLLRAGRLVGITELEAQGPGMAVRGRAEMVGQPAGAAGARPDHARADPGAGRGDAPDRARRADPGDAVGHDAGRDGPGGYERLGARGLGPVRRRHPVSTPCGSAPGRSCARSRAHAEHDGKRLVNLRLQSGGPERVQAVVAPDGTGRRVQVRAADGGALLRVAGVFDDLVGGALAIDGRYDDAVRPSVLSGTVDLRDFHIRNAPAIGKVLQAITIYGIPEAASGPGLAFSQLSAPFRWDGSALTTKNAQAFSASLGLTVEGRVDTRARTLDLKGTVVPAYAVNSALGRIPLLGELFKAERGGGLVAVNYTVRGPIADPAVSVNPLSALTPGVLRRLFKLFD